MNAVIDQFATAMTAAGISPSSFDLPVFIDIEDGRQKNTDYATMTSMMRSGMQRIKNKGYETGFYASSSWANNRFNGKQLEKEGYTSWIASWYLNNAELNPYTAVWNGAYPGIWQYRSTGSVNGFPGRLDMNYLYPALVNWA